MKLKESRVWPVEEAMKVVERMRKTGKKLAVFETGYGPSGLPHMGTIAEVIRTRMIQKAYDALAKEENALASTAQLPPSTLIAFVDDMDGLRKVPGNVPNQEMLSKNLNKPLYKVPDPFEETESFAHYNAQRFSNLLEKLGYRKFVTIMKASEQYETGNFNRALVEVLKHHKIILEIMGKHLGEERRATYSPFMPISPVTGAVLAKGVREYHPSTIVFKAEDGKDYEIPVTDGNCKLQWKPDFGMRWFALGVDYELYGKDLVSSVEVASEICKTLGAHPPEGFQYEHFLAEDGGRVSKSKGNETVTLDDWIECTPKGTLEHFLFQNPRRAKRMRITDLPTYVEAFLAELNEWSKANHHSHSVSDTVCANPNDDKNARKLKNNINELDAINICDDNLTNNASTLNTNNAQSDGRENINNAVTQANAAQSDVHENTNNTNGANNEFQRLESACYFMDHVPNFSDVSFKLAVSLACAMHAPDAATLIEKMQIEEHDLLGIEIATTAFNFFIKHIASGLQILPMPESMASAVETLINKLENAEANAESWQSCFFQTAKEHKISIKQWFEALYQTLIGTKQGPKLGSFCALYGVNAVINKLRV